jgi:1-acyl-sn-glycerol-3-phosphate acyltransferase
MTPLPWTPQTAPPRTGISPLGWLRVVLRAPLLGLAVYGGLLLLLCLRLIERPVFGLGRPLTPWITVGVCRLVLRIMGLRLRLHGAPMTARGAIVANHASWLDIFVLNAVQPVYFVAKSEVAGWPGIGVLARAVGTLFIDRRGAEALRQKWLFEARLRAGHRLLFFPEGTSTDGLRVLPFKSTLFAAFHAEGLAPMLSIQPATIAYHAPAGQDRRLYGWWGSMGFAPHLVTCLAAKGAEVAVILHPPRPVGATNGRKALAAACEGDVRAGLAAELGHPGDGVTQNGATQDGTAPDWRAPDGGAASGIRRGADVAAGMAPETDASAAHHALSDGPPGAPAPATVHARQPPQRP